MAGMLELKDCEFNTTMINPLRAVMEKDTMQELMGNVSREIEIQRKNNNKKIAGDQEHCNKRKNAF